MTYMLSIAWKSIEALHQNPISSLTLSTMGQWWIAKKLLLAWDKLFGTISFPKILQEAKLKSVFNLNWIFACFHIYFYLFSC